MGVKLGEMEGRMSHNDSRKGGTGQTGERRGRSVPSRQLDNVVRNILVVKQ
jgi:hypothetical protein